MQMRTSFVHSDHAQRYWQSVIGATIRRSTLSTLNSERVEAGVSPAGASDRGPPTIDGYILPKYMETEAEEGRRP